MVKILMIALNLNTSPVFETQSKSCRSSWLEYQIINIELKKNQQKVSGPPPKLSASDWRACGNFQHCTSQISKSCWKKITWSMNSLNPGDAYVNGLVQERCNSSALAWLAMELHLCHINPSVLSESLVGAGPSVGTLIDCWPLSCRDQVISV